MRKKINIKGMSCGHCVNRIKNSLAVVDGVKSTEVNLNGYAIVDGGDIKDEALIFAVDDAGYDVQSIEEV